MSGPAAGQATAPKWYDGSMGGTHNVVMGDRGRLVVPAEVRDRLNLKPGTRLILLESASGLVLLTRDQLKARVRADLAGLNLVEELLAERRAAAAAEDEP
jgi:AbrB family looped-hinge helix DNA binding protein